MKLIFFYCFLIINTTSLLVCASEDSSETLWGRWKFMEYIYENQRHPRLNPNLNLFFEFNETGSNRLWWYRDNEKGFCERVGMYQFDSQLLIDEVAWVHPQNQAECSQHPDMQMGQKATNTVTFENGHLHLHLTLKGQPFIYIWHKQ